MRFAGNVIWFVFGGAVLALIWLLGAAVFAISIIGLPLTRAAIEMAKMSAFPFGKDVVHVRELDRKGVTATTATTGTIGFIFNVLWACTFGIVLFFSYIIAGIINCITIIGIPFGIQSFKLAGISFWPVGRRVVSIELAKAVREENARMQLQAMRPSA
ncbi:YccF domain-containing protein [Pseudochrobactrum sp. AO18b]|uniref:YccF domain-containing protein n=1 Tax=Pseudochrobactrum sp. AO18b TaxID=1201036 RepID=UPI00039B0AA2|nr:YccF domain-containing protein [Pseudochrobactrum sp. AO18b]